MFGASFTGGFKKGISGSRRFLTIEEFEEMYHTRIVGHREYLDTIKDTTSQYSIKINRSPEVYSFEMLKKLWPGVLTTMSPVFSINPQKKEVIIIEPVFNDAEVKPPLVLIDSDALVFIIFPVEYKGKIYYYIIHSFVDEFYKIYNPEELAVNMVINGDVEQLNPLHFLTSKVIIGGFLDYLTQGISEILNEERLILKEYLDNVVTSVAIMTDNGEPALLIRFSIKDSTVEVDLVVRDTYLTMSSIGEFYEVLEKENYIPYFITLALRVLNDYIMVSDNLNNSLVMPSTVLSISTHEGNIKFLHGHHYKEFQIPKDYLETGDEEMLITYIVEKVLPSIEKSFSEFHLGLKTVIREH